MRSSAVLSLLVFFSEFAVRVGASVEREKSVPAQTAPQQAGFGSQTECLLFPRGKPRTKGTSSAFARLSVKYDHYITGRSSMPVLHYEARREEDAPIPKGHQ